MNKQQFNEIQLMPLFEIENENGDYEIYHIVADDKGLHAGGMCNVGFIQRGITVEWDDTFSLDEQLQHLYELCLDDMTSL